jgi:cytochrome c5
LIVMLRLLMALPLVAAASITVAAAQDPAPDLSLLPAGAGRELVGAKCGTCHNLAIVTGQRRDRAAWEASIDQMIGRGAEISDAEYEVIAAYLGTHFGEK